MAPEKFGTKETEDIERLGLVIEEKLAQGFADGNWTGMDSLDLASSILTAILPAVTGADKIKDEARNYSREEIAHLAQVVREKTSAGVGDIVEGMLFLETGVLKVTGRYIPNE